MSGSIWTAPRQIVHGASRRSRHRLLVDAMATGVIISGERGAEAALTKCRTTSLVAPVQLLENHHRERWPVLAQASLLISAES